jgi:hypothetical protein
MQFNNYSLTLSIGCVQGIFMQTRERSIGIKLFKSPYGNVQRHLLSHCSKFCKAKLAQLSPAGAKDMMNTNPKHWSRA